MRNQLKNPFCLIIFTFLFCLFLFLFIILQKNLVTAYETTASNDQITVIIDAGHGGEDGGAIGKNNVLEKDLNLIYATKIGEKLKSNGINVIYTRTEDILLYDKNADYKNRKKSLDLAARVKIAQEKPNSIFVSIHMNSFQQEKYRGLQIYYSKNDPRSKTLAYEIQKEIKTSLQPYNNRKITEATSRIFLLDKIERPAILIECGFLSNPDECVLLASETYQNRMCEIISQEIKNYVEKYSQTY